MSQHKRRTRTPRKRRTAAAPAEPPAEDCADRPQGEPSLVLSRAARVMVYARRAAAGESVFNDGDLVARTAEAEKARDGLPAGMTK